MQKNANIYDIARISGVSKSTVSRVINGHKGVNEETRKRVQKAIDDCTYVPSNTARNLSTVVVAPQAAAVPSQAVVLLVHGITNPFFSRIISAILEKMRALNIPVSLHSCEAASGAQMTDEAVAIFNEERPRGIILLGGYFDENYGQLQALGVPIVMASATVHQPDRGWFSSIMLDEYYQGEKMAGYVCQFGHKSIAVIGRYHHREAGMNRVFGEFGVSPHYVELDFDGAHKYKTGYNAANKLLDEGQYTCFMCLSDVLAMGAMKAVQERGLRIPDDISIIGFDGLEGGQFLHPTLTSFVQPFDEIAEKSVSTMVSLLHENGHNHHFLLNTDLQEGGSFRPL